jgi:tRNA threonylcarbamoyladenosine biosynthesis protein TsaB
MNILAIDTATEACSVALQCADDARFRFSQEPRAHARVLLPMIDELMAEAGMAPAALDAVAFGRGPGSFTGVRIATAAAQAVAFGVDIPALPISSLALVAQQGVRLHGIQRAAVSMDARMGEVYWGCYVAGGDGLVLLQGDEAVLPPQALVLPDERTWTAIGSGWQAYSEALQTVVVSTCPEPAVTLPHAQDMLPLAMRALLNGEGVSAEQALPVYLRNHVALTEAERGTATRD